MKETIVLEPERLPEISKDLSKLCYLVDGVVNGSIELLISDECRDLISELYPELLILVPL